MRYQRRCAMEKRKLMRYIFPLFNFLSLLIASLTCVGHSRIFKRSLYTSLLVRSHMPRNFSQWEKQSQSNLILDPIMTLTDKPLPFSIDDILKYDSSKTSSTPNSSVSSLLTSPFLSSFSNVIKNSCPGKPNETKRIFFFSTKILLFLDHRSSSCHSNHHHCHLSTLQLNSAYPNLDTFIHHRRCRRTRTVFSGSTTFSFLS